jgi:hypothetical protein
MNAQGRAGLSVSFQLEYTPVIHYHVTLVISFLTKGGTRFWIHLDPGTKVFKEINVEVRPWIVVVRPGIDPTRKFHLKNATILDMWKTLAKARLVPPPPDGIEVDIPKIPKKERQQKGSYYLSKRIP